MPALDAWQIPNKGAYPEPRGYCSGSATTAMWYFLEQYRAAGASHLFGLYDNNGGTRTPGFWKDDAHAIRLAATVQARTDWNSLASSFFWRQAWIAGALAYDAFRYAMAVTREPQLVFVHSPSSNHAMIVYKVDPGHLWISDPNFPGEARSTAFDWKTKTLAPYVGKETWPTLMYAAKSAIVPWSDLATAWGEFEDGTIGNDVFPKVEFSVDLLDFNTEPLVNGYETDQESIMIAKDVPGQMTIYRGTEKLPEGLIPLAIGDNEIGILVEAFINNRRKWTQFKRFTIVRTPAPSPSPSGPASGSWDLVSGPDQIGETQPLSGIGWSIKGDPGELPIEPDPGGLQSTVSSPKEDFTVKLGWLAPDTLLPGEPLDIGAEVRVVKKPKDCTKQPDPACDFSVEIDAGLLVMWPPKNPQQGPQAIASANGRGQIWHATTPQIVPEYDRDYGATMVLQVGIQHADAQRWYQYVYEWSGPR